YDERKGTLNFVEKLDQQDGAVGKQAINEETEFYTPYQAAYAG
ncbi:unnamed protein product, partial [Rotaria magnacalcarata]